MNYGHGKEDDKPSVHIAYRSHVNSPWFRRGNADPCQGTLARREPACSANGLDAAGMVIAAAGVHLRCSETVFVETAVGKSSLGDQVCRLVEALYKPRNPTPQQTPETLALRDSTLQTLHRDKSPLRQQTP